MAVRKIVDFEFIHRYLGHVNRIQRVLRDYGYEADLTDCAQMWEDYSEDCADNWIDRFVNRWVSLPSSDEELWEILEFRVNSYL